MILDDIIRDSQIELISKKAEVPLERMKDLAMKKPHPADFASALRGKEIKLIAEVKKASPSKGLIVPDFDPVAIAKIYASNGAAAISVLTETKYFLGSPLYLQKINQVLGPTRPPLLRKDFIYDPYQVYEARAYGADAVLLIVSILNPASLDRLLGLSRQLNMDALVEVHDEAEAEIAVKSGAEIIGINNRDLRNFEVDLNTTRRLRHLIPAGNIVVSESGIRTRDDLQRLKGWGVDAVLVGESFLTSSDIPSRIKELM